MNVNNDYVDDEDIDDKDKDNKQEKPSKTDLNNNSMNVDNNDKDEDSKDEDAQKLKDACKWISPAPCVVDVRCKDVHLLYDTKVQHRGNIILDPVIYYNVLTKLEKEDKNYQKQTFWKNTQ